MRTTLRKLNKYRDESWDFRTADTKQYTHCFHPYPAMMIPQVAGRILDEFGEDAKLLFDPYCGTGTSLVEANLRGINAIGSDINPLARLIAKVKTTIIPVAKVDAHLKDFYDLIFSIRLGGKEIKPKIPEFKNIGYWFKKETQYWLAVVKEYIERIEDEDIQDFFKVAFSETVREVSLTRNSEFKLYRMSEKQIEEFNPDVLSIMVDKLIRNRKGMAEYISRKKNKASSKIFGFNTVCGIPENIILPESIDIIVTSPPYGDSRTTVAYGQFSRLSNQWLGLEEYNEVDKISMGGIRRKGLKNFKFEPLDSVLSQIAHIDKKRAYDVISFYIDYEKSITNISRVVKRGGIVAYVVGNRRVKGIEIPNDEITGEFFERNGFKHIKTILRDIPNKRMPKRNSPTNVAGVTDTTMTYEYIVILRKEEGGNDT
ncbi:DNA methyltransferase [Candidatus Sumerlaeota bacterium]|nr:DNA methyltransferase [Candidatus Sumerlaeota bacterium]